MQKEISLSSELWDYVVTIILLFFIGFLVMVLVIVLIGNTIGPCFGTPNCVVTTVHTGSQITRTVYQP